MTFHSENDPNTRNETAEFHQNQFAIGIYVQNVSLNLKGKYNSVTFIGDGLASDMYISKGKY